MSLRIRRGTNAQRLTTTLDLGEIGYTTDTQKLYAGDGVSAGGRHVLASSAGNGLFFNETSQQLDLSVGALTLTTADITESSSLYFTQARAQAAVAAAFTAGQSLGNVTFSYDDTTAKIYANVTPDGVGIMSVSEDTAPVLGGNLTLGGHDIVGSGNLTVVGALTATSYTGAILLTNDNISGTGNIDITGNILATSYSGSITLTNDNISGTGNIDITGNVDIIGDITASTYGRIVGGRVILNQTADAGMLVMSNASGTSGIDLLTVRTHHDNSLAAAAVFTRARGTILAPEPLVLGDSIFNLAFFGRTTNGTDAVACAVTGEVGGAVSAGIMPGKVVISTTGLAGTTTPKLTIGQDGKQIIEAPALVAGASSGEVNTTTISSWMSVMFNGVDYAIPMYQVRP